MKTPIQVFSVNSLVAFMLALVFATTALTEHQFHAYISANWHPTGGQKFREDLAFIAANTRPGERVGILANDQAMLYMATKTVPGFTGPSLAELQSTADLNNLKQQIQEGKVQKLFFGSILFNMTALDQSAVTVSMYRLAGVGPDGRVNYYVRARCFLRTVKPAQQGNALSAARRHR